MPAISPDGEQIAANCLIPGEPVEESLCILNFDGNIIREFKMDYLGIDFFYHLSWSSDGTQLAFDTNDTIFILSLPEGTLNELDARGSVPIIMP